jgi:hypothetical protein
MQSQNTSRNAVTIAAVATAALLTTHALAADTGNAVTVSISGSTAMRNFTISPDFSALTPGTSITVGVGANEKTYTAAPVIQGSQFPSVQLAFENANTADPHTPSPVANANFLAYRIEWHEQGSVEGVAELANDQVGYFSPLVTGSSRNPVPSTVGNRIYVQRNAITGVPFSNNGFTLNGGNYNTYDPAEYNADGRNLLGAQNRVQMAISDVRATQGFSIAGPAAFDRKAGQAGYGKGNPALATAGSNILGLGSANVRRQLIDQSALNMETTKVDPKTGANYAAGAWNTAGVNNTDNKTVAISATTFAANPGTGLTDLNKADAQWLQATGRLANGADFNVATRDINSGTLNVAANNVGLDPSFAVGENDDGNGLGSVTQTAVGSNIRFSGKTSGGGQLRPTVQAARMGIGHLGLSDVLPSSVNSAVSPLRALRFRNDNAAGQGVQVSIDSISNGSYALFQNQTYVTIKDPTGGTAAVAAFRAANPGSTLTDAQVWAGLTDAQTGIKGDNAGNDVADFRRNILGSASTFPSNSTFRNPANGLLNNGFLPTQFMQVKKVGDGDTHVSNLKADGGTYDSNNYETIKNAYGDKFAVGAPEAVTSGSSSTRYGAGANAIPVTAANYLFGDFNGDAKRDYQDLKYAQAGQQTLGASNTDYTTGGNASVVYNGFSKGDLIVKGDYNADGKFDGRDLYSMARGTALANAGQTVTGASNPDTVQLTGNAADGYRSGQLYKNAALDYLQANATADQKAQARANAANDAAGINAFNKFDINRDGLVNRSDAQIVNAFVDVVTPKSIANLQDQLNAVVRTDISAAGTAFVNASGAALDPTDPTNAGVARKSISLVDVELQDNLTITHVATGGGTSDFKLIREALGSALQDGDTDFTGGVNFTDLGTLLNNYNLAGKWSNGDFDFDGIIDFTDLGGLLNNYNQSASGLVIDLRELSLDGQAIAALSAEGFTLVPEPGVGVLAAVGLMAMARRRRRN